MSDTKSLFCFEEQVIAKAEALLDQSGPALPAQDFAALLERYRKLHRQSALLVKMGDRMQNQLNSLNERLVRSEEKYRGIFEGSIQGIFRATVRGRLLDVNPAMARMLGHDSPGAMLSGGRATVADAFLSRIQGREFLRAVCQSGLLRDHPLKLRRRDGGLIWVEISVRGVRDEAGRLAELEGLVADITEKRRMLQELQNLARRDGLTGLWNRRFFLELGDREMARARREKHPLSVIYFDVDHFKGINDTHGHEAGDKVLRELAIIGSSHLREVDVFGRMGGEEFAILLPGTGEEGAVCVAERLRASFEDHEVFVADTSVRCTASFGVAQLDAGPPDLDGLIRRADEALYAAKSGGRNAVVHSPGQARSEGREDGDRP